MKNKELATRYACALYDLANEQGKVQQTLVELEALNTHLVKDKEFFVTPMINAGEKQRFLEKALASSGLSEISKHFLLLLAQKNRLPIFFDIVPAFQEQHDRAQGLTHGLVRSVNELTTEEKNKVESLVSKATGEKVVMDYKQDPSVIGGVVATVGSYTFDDTLTTHLKLLKDELKRRAH